MVVDGRRGGGAIYIKRILTIGSECDLKKKIVNGCYVRKERELYKL